MANTQRTILASSSATATTTTSGAALQGIVRSRVKKSTRNRSKLGKNIELVLPQLKAAVINVDYLPPSSPVSVPPSPTVSIKCKSVITSNPSPTPCKPIKESCTPTPAPTPCKHIQTCTSKPAPSVADRLSVSFMPQGKLVGREDEANRLHSQLSELLQPDAQSGSMYICGLPGTGKTLTITRIVESLSARSVWVNCANLARANQVFDRLAHQLGVEESKDPLANLREYAKSDGKKVVLVLDEVDFLTTRDQLVLYALFELSKGESSRFVVVGIANALDLPTRLLPWLRAGGCLPVVHTFAPYCSSALTGILRQRLERHEMSDAALALAAKKVAAGTGDARAALDVVRESITNGAGGVAAVARVAATKGVKQAVNTIRFLPVVQQLALCAAANATLTSCGKRATLGGLHDGFTRLCRRAHVPPLNFADFADVCANALVHHALLDVPIGRGKAGRSMRGRQVRLRVGVEDVKAGVADKGFLPFLLGSSS